MYKTPFGKFGHILQVSDTCKGVRWGREGRRKSVIDGFEWVWSPKVATMDDKAEEH